MLERNRVAMNDQERRKELANFLRTRRERLLPEAVGLPVGTRRRTPGLRREELALAAGIGVTWYTRLEQGRDITVSSQVLESLARIFGLDAAERNHLFILAREEQPADPFPLTDSISPALQCILDTLGICPAYVANPRWDMVAWNQAMCHVYTDFGALSPRERNIPRYMLTHPHQRSLFDDWEQEAQSMLALFRASTERYVGDIWFKELVADLQQCSPEFRSWWPRYDIQAAHSGPKVLNHPLVGRLYLQSNSFQVVDAPDLRLIIYTPLAEASTPQKLAQLLGVPVIQAVG
jgi:transcriptional regulator with XRE-family HTH domain